MDTTNIFQFLAIFEQNFTVWPQITNLAPIQLGIMANILSYM